MKGMMIFIFKLVRDFLVFLSLLTNKTYREVNIIVYYYIIPFLYLGLIDYKIETHLLKVVFLISACLSFFLIKDFEKFSNSLFDKSVFFLRLFERVGWSYIVSSVIICVFFPVIILVIIFLI